MREIKFRAWFDGHMYEVAKLDFWGDPEQATCDMAGLGENGEGEELFDIYAGEVELMQYTGLKDKNGNEIYEGDIIQLINEDLEEIKVICEFGTAKRQIFDNLVEITGFYFKRLDDDRKTFPIINNYLGKHDLELFEVIGNIHDNLELLKDEEQTGGTERKEREMEK